jgi:hypothetical protein
MIPTSAPLVCPISEGHFVNGLRRYRLYIDESGNPQMGSSERYLGLLGLIAPRDKYIADFKPDLLKIKQRHFTDDPDSPVIMHREEVAQCLGPFSVLQDDKCRADFNTDITDFYKRQDFALIAVVIDKESHLSAYGDEAKHPYHYCAEAMLERFLYFLKGNCGYGDVFAESRGDEPDALLQHEWKRLRARGTRYVPRRDLAERLIDRPIEFRTKDHNVYGLQVADMLAKVCTRDVLIDYGHHQKFRSGLEYRIARIIDCKYHRNWRTGSAVGFGKKLLHAHFSAQKKPAPLRKRLITASEGPGDHG